MEEGCKHEWNEWCTNCGPPDFLYIPIGLSDAHSTILIDDISENDFELNMVN